MKRTIFLITSAFLFLIFINSVSAAISDINYPVSELGNCNSQQECEKYCDDSANIEPCLNFAEKKGLMSKDEIAEARKFMPFIKQGQTPGNCKGQRECKSYCDNDANLNECLEFAKKAGAISDEEYQIVKKTGGKGPGGCKSKEACDAYCKENMEECKKWGDEHGLVPEDQKNDEGRRSGPGGCQGEEECKAFCEKPENTKACMEFSVNEGKMSKEEYERVTRQDEEARRGPPPGEWQPGQEGPQGGPEEYRPGEGPPPDSENRPPAGFEGPGSPQGSEGSVDSGSDSGSSSGSSDSGSSSSSSSSSDSSSSSRGGESAPATGNIISEKSEDENFFMKIIKFIFRI